MCCAMLMLLQSTIEEDQCWLPNTPLHMEYGQYQDQDQDQDQIPNTPLHMEYDNNSTE